MTIYTTLKNTADRLTKKFGVKYTFTRYTDTGYSTTTGAVTRTTTTYTSYCVKQDYTQSERASEAIQEGDVRLIAQDATFAIGDTVTIDSDVYKIVNFVQSKPGSTSIYYEIQLRR